MITPTSAGTQAQLRAVRPTGGTLGKEEFLNILVAQLRNQDPLSPMDGSQFASQLAQFSSLEQLITLNGAVSDQGAIGAVQALTLDTTLGASLLGRTVLARGNQLEVGADEQLSVTVDVGSGGGRAQVRILDASGHQVATRELGTVPGGRQTLAWSNQLDGAPEVPPGIYTYQVVVTADGGAVVNATPYSRGRVTGLHFENGAVVLQAGALRIPLANLAEIEPEAAASPPTTSLMERLFR